MRELGELREAVEGTLLEAGKTLSPAEWAEFIADLDDYIDGLNARYGS